MLAGPGHLFAARGRLEGITVVAAHVAGDGVRDGVVARREHDVAEEGDGVPVALRAHFLGEERNTEHQKIGNKKLLGETCIKNAFF